MLKYAYFLSILTGLIFLITFLRNEKIYSLWAVILILFSRLPIIFTNIELSVDESHALTIALSMREWGVPFIDYDGNTAGPFRGLLPCLLNLVGFPIDFSTAHFITAILISSFFLISYQTIKKWYNGNVAINATLPVLIWILFDHSYDYVHFASELVSVNLIGISTFFLVLFYQNTGTISSLIYFLAGLVTAMPPFSKLQSAPITLFLLLSTLILLYKNHIKQGRIKETILYLLGGITYLVLVIFYLMWHDVLNEFYLYYIKGNISYGSSSPIWYSLYRYFKHIFTEITLFNTTIIIPFVFVIFNLFLQKYRNTFYNMFFLYCRICHNKIRAFG